MGTTQAHANAFAPFNGWASSSNPSGDLKSLQGLRSPVVHLSLFVFSDSPSLLDSAVPAAWAWDGGHGMGCVGWGVGLASLCSSGVLSPTSSQSLSAVPSQDRV